MKKIGPNFFSIWTGIEWSNDEFYYEKIEKP